MNDSRQVINKIDWLDEQRRKDRKMAVALRERINVLQKENKELVCPQNEPSILTKKKPMVAHQNKQKSLNI